MKDDARNRRQIVVAALAASLFMLIFGTVYRTIAAPVNKVALDPSVLESFPRQIGEWTGEDIPIDLRIRKVMDADAYINRRYTRRNGSESISLYFPCGANVSALLQHVPENCYVGAGWTLVDRHTAELSPGGQTKLPCSIVRFARTGFDTRNLILVHFLVADGEFFTTFSAVAQKKGWRHFAETHYAAQVQVVASADGMSVEAATKLATSFATDAAPFVGRSFENLRAGLVVKATPDHSLQTQ
jgi:hypothetical protein